MLRHLADRGISPSARIGGPAQPLGEPTSGVDDPGNIATVDRLDKRTKGSRRGEMSLPVVVQRGLSGLPLIRLTLAKLCPLRER